MVVNRVTDGKRIAQLLASEIDGREDPPLDGLAVVNADRDVEGTVEGALAYEIGRGEEVVGAVYVHEDRAHVELWEGLDGAKARAGEADIRVRPKAVEPPRVLVFVESGAEVKRAVSVLVAALTTDETNPATR